MNKKLLLTSFVAMNFVMPAMAVPETMSYPDPDAVEPATLWVNREYENAAVERNLGVYEGSVYAIAEYGNIVTPLNPGYYLPGRSTDATICPANSSASTVGHYCPGGSNAAYNESGEDQGIENCPDGYNLVREAASMKVDCYKTCASVTGASAMTGHDYWGPRADDCEPSSCNSGWTLVSHVDGVNGYDIMNGFFAATTTASDSAYVPHTGAIGGDASTFFYPETQNLNDHWGLKRSNEGESDMYVYGQAFCASPYVSVMQNAQGINSDNPTRATTTQLEPYQQAGSGACFCKLKGFKESSLASWDSLESPWLFVQTMDNCGTNCAQTCMDIVYNGTESAYKGWVTALFASASGAQLARCDANEIKIKWYAHWGNVDGAAAVAANNAGTVTYGGNIRTPALEPETPYGKVFKGWKFSTMAPDAQSQPQQSLANPD